MFIKISGTVIKGSNQGRYLGFPTANICLRKTISSGIYAGRVLINRKEYPAAIYIGKKSAVLEAHLLGFKGNLYRKKIFVFVDKKIRPVYAFKHNRELIAAIGRDVRVVRNYYANVYRHRPLGFPNRKPIAGKRRS